MATASQLLGTLAGHIGKGNGIGVKRLAYLHDIPERQVRHFISELRDDGHAICGTPQDGYFVAANSKELEDTCEFLRRRALHSLGLEAKLRNIPLPDLLGQLHLPT